MLGVILVLGPVLGGGHRAASCHMSLLVITLAAISSWTLRWPRPYSATVLLKAHEIPDKSSIIIVIEKDDASNEGVIDVNQHSSLNPQ